MSEWDHGNHSSHHENLVDSWLRTDFFVQTLLVPTLSVVQQTIPKTDYLVFSNQHHVGGLFGEGGGEKFRLQSQEGKLVNLQQDTNKFSRWVVITRPWIIQGEVKCKTESSMSQVPHQGCHTTRGVVQWIHCTTVRVVQFTFRLFEYVDIRISRIRVYYNG